MSKVARATILGFHCSDISGESCSWGIPTDLGTCQFAVGGACINIETQKEVMRKKIESFRKKKNY